MPDDVSILDILGWRDRRDRRDHGVDGLGNERRGSTRDGVDDRHDPDYANNRGNSPLFHPANH